MSSNLHVTETANTSVLAARNLANRSQSLYAGVCTTAALTELSIALLHCFVSITRSPRDNLREPLVDSGPLRDVSLVIAHNISLLLFVSLCLFFPWLLSNNVQTYLFG